jgi:hypothetical protein
VAPGDVTSFTHAEADQLRPAMRANDPQRIRPNLRDRFFTTAANSITSAADASGSTGTI